MRGIDTNVLVRYLTLDDAEQSAEATRVFEAAAESGDPVFISTVVLCEVVWVLESAYGYGREAIGTALDALLRAAQIHYRDKDLLWHALADYRGGRGDFADHVIGRDGAAGGCATTVTFDRELRDSPLFDVLGLRRG